MFKFKFFYKMKKNDFWGGNSHFGDDIDEYETQEMIERRKKVLELRSSIKKEHPDWDDCKCGLYACGKLGIINFGMPLNEVFK